MVRIMRQANNPAERLYYSSRILVFGPSGAGKTTFAGTVGRPVFQSNHSDIPCPLLVLNQDGGADIIPTAGNKLLAIDNHRELEQLIIAIEQAVRKGPDYPPYTLEFAGEAWEFSGLLIDTINMVQSVVKPGIFANERNPLRAFGEMKTLLKDNLIIRLGKLGEQKPFHLVITCQMADKSIAVVDEGELKGDEIKESVVWKADLEGSIRESMPQLFDIVVTCRLNPTTGNYEAITRDTSTPFGTFPGKLRFGSWLTNGNPGIIRNPTWAGLLKLYAIDVSDPDSITPFGSVERPHWALIATNQEKLEQVLGKNYSSTLKKFFGFLGIRNGDWESLAEKNPDLEAKELVGRFAQHLKETAQPEAEEPEAEEEEAADE